MHRLARWLEPRLYRLLRVPPEQKLLEGKRRVGSADTWRAERRARWLAVPWYGHAADRLIRTVNLTGGKYGMSRRALRGVRDRLDDRRAARALAGARTLVFTSHFAHSLKDETEVDGYFDLGGGLSFGVSIHSLESFTAAADMEWETGRVYQLAPIYTSSEHVIVPVRSLGPDLVEEALRRWYVDRFDWKWNHWTHREGRLPYVEIRLEWIHLAEEQT